MKSRPEWKILALVIATGISSVTTQLVTLREFLSQFEGNEFVIALIFFCWLLLGAAGTLAARWWISDHRPPTIGHLGAVSWALIALPGVQILVIRWLRDLVFVRGASVGFYPTFGYIFTTLAPYAFLVGLALPLAWGVLRTRQRKSSGATIYIFDNIGDASGAALFGFVLVSLFSPFESLAIAHIALVAATAVMLGPRLKHPGHLLGGLLSVSILVGGLWMEPLSLSRSEGDLAYYRESRYGRITVRKDREQYTLFTDGVPLFSNQNRSLAEETIHYPLAQVAAPQRVLLISSQGGVMTELAKYKGLAVDYVELDPLIAEVQFRYGLIQKIPGLQTIHLDGRAYLDTTETTYDAIIVNLPEPETYQVNRFFTTRFFELVHRRLKPGGVFSFSMQGYDNYVAEAQRQKLSALYNTLQPIFGHVLMLPGQRIFFVAADHPLHTDIPQRLKSNAISTWYIRNYFAGNLTAQRIAQLNQLMDPSTPTNSDLAPQLMRLMLQQWFAKFATRPLGFMLAVGAMVGLYAVFLKRQAWVLFTTGFLNMGAELLIIFAFQIYFGYIYARIGWIVTVFLAGLLPGAWLGERYKRMGKRWLILTDAVLILQIAILIPALWWVADSLPQIFFLAYGFGISLVCGFQFPVALNLSGSEKSAVTESFSADLVGAACGALVTSVILIPLVGVIGTLAAFMGLKLVSLLIMTGTHVKA